MAKLEFFFDRSSPSTYLAFPRIHDVAARMRAMIVWRPILVGGVFNAVNKGMYARRDDPDPRQASCYGKGFRDAPCRCQNRKAAAFPRNRGSRIEAALMRDD